MFPDDQDDPFDEIVRNTDLDARLARLSARADRSRPTASKGTGPRTSRRSAARGSRRTALGLSAVTTVGLAGWMYGAAGATSTNLASIGSTTDATTATTAAATTASATASTTATTTASSAASTSTTTTSTTLKDGTWTGTSTSTRYGPVQVQITVSGGKITAVNVLNYPKSDNKSASINATAVPRLVSATLTAQSANVSNVSGATYTTTGYKTSLQSAIDAARKAS